MKEDELATASHALVSRETRARLTILVRELRRWQQVKNLVAESTLPEVWSRHIADSLQLRDYEPGAHTWLDLGSGAGFPGLVLGISLADQTGALVHLVESNARKCAFLRHVARETEARVKVHEARLERSLDQFVGQVDVVTARALAPLADLFEWIEPLMRAGAVGLFPKGRGVAAELTDAEKSWKFTAEMLPSQTDSQARILRVTALERAPRAAEDKRG